VGSNPAGRARFSNVRTGDTRTSPYRRYVLGTMSRAAHTSAVFTPRPDTGHPPSSTACTAAKRSLAEHLTVYRRGLTPVQKKAGFPTRPFLVPNGRLLQRIQPKVDAMLRSSPDDLVLVLVKEKTLLN